MKFNNKSRRLALCRGLALILAGLPALAWAAALEQLQHFLQDTRTLRAEFSQIVVAPAGRKPQRSAGTVAIARPGKLRWEIRTPYPQLMVGDGERFWIYDPELDQVTVKKADQALGGTPAALLAGSNDLQRNFRLTEGGEADGLAWVEAVPRTTDSGFEKIRLGLANGELRAMALHDNFGQVTHVRFSGIERNAALPPALFKFTPPAGADVIGE